jgi:hypothetical protein
MVNIRRVVAAKAETVYGTDSIPTLTADAVMTRNYAIVPLEVDQLQRNFDSRTYGATRGKPTNRRMRSSYEVELAGSGVAGTAPPWMRLLAACGMATPTLVATTSATQRFALPSAVPGSLSEYSWVENQQRKMIGARGTYTLDFTAGQVPFANLQFTGLVPDTAPRPVATPAAAVFTSWMEPLEVNNVNTLLTLDGFSAVTRSLTIDAGVAVNLRSLIGARYVNSGNHSATGRLVIEAPSAAAKDYLATLEAGALVALSLTHGVGAGNIIEVTGAKTQVTGITESAEDDVLMFNIDLLFTTDGGSDDLTIIAR